MKVLRTTQKVSLLLVSIILVIGLVANSFMFITNKNASKKYDALVKEANDNGYSDVFKSSFMREDISFDDVDYYRLEDFNATKFGKATSINYLIKKDDEFIKETDDTENLIVLGKKLAILETDEDIYPYDFLIIDCYKIVSNKDYNKDDIMSCVLKLDIVLTFLFIVTFLMFIFVTIICLVKTLKEKRKNKTNKKKKEKQN